MAHRRSHRRARCALFVLLSAAGLGTAQAVTLAAAATAVAGAASAPAAVVSGPAVAASAPASPATASTTLQSVTITGKAPPTAGVAGWGDVPLSRAPLQATTVDQAALREIGSTRLADLVRFDPAVSDSYNAEGYIDYLTVRGYVIDNRFNYQRDGLPINAETSIPLDNKARVDVLKGLSGMQAGTSAPGGLVDIVVKRPLDQPLTSAYLQYRERGSVLASADISRRFGEGDAFGLRINAAAERIDPIQNDAEGNRNLLALAGDWRLGASTLIEAEIENSHRSQPSVPGFSLLGNSVPPVPNPRIDLNDQPWSLPVVFDATTASLRVTQRLAADWSIVAHGATQRLRTDDRTAFPFGCTATDGTYYPDRFCPDGTFDLYDFRSNDERRRSDAVDLSLHGRFDTGPVSHALVAGGLRDVVHNRFNAETYNFAGTGNIDGTAIVPAAPEALDTNTDRDEYSTELYLRDAIALDARTTLWLGARHTRIDRGSVATDGTEPTRYAQTFTTPFAAASYALWRGQIVYASWGEGVQSDVAPNLPIFVNAGQAAPAAKSRQSELGFKGDGDTLQWTLAAFEIHQPLFGDQCTTPDDGSERCLHTLLGDQHHRGIEAGATWRQGPWQLHGGAQWLHARVEGTQDPTLDGKRPTNVPALSARLVAGYAVAAVPGLQMQAGASYDSSRDVLPDNSISIPR